MSPRTDGGERLLRFDLPGLEIGIGEYAEGPTGCTVFSFPTGASQAVDIRGGLVGYVGDYGMVDAICLTGGSLYGLEAVSGVSAEKFARSGYSLDDFATVSGACIFDYAGRDNSIYPDVALGRAALATATPGIFPLGRKGAGIYARHGQGGAYRQLGNVRLAVFTVLNCMGEVFDRSGNVVTRRSDLQTESEGAETPSPTRHTTLTVLVTDQVLPPRHLTQIGRQVHASMARAIHPFHTLRDGDVLFSLSTNAVEDGTLHPTALGVAASDLAWDAVLSALED